MENTPKGKLMPIGGNENKGENSETSNARESYKTFQEAGVLRRMLDECKGNDTHVEVITAATDQPKEVARDYRKAFKLLGAKNFNFINMESAKDTDTPDHLERIQKADVVLFSGGDQTSIVEYLKNSEFAAILRDRYQNDSNFMIAGTSAGAMAMGEVMIERSDASEEYLKGDLDLNQGLALVDDLIIDTHFVQRGRFWRLGMATGRNPDCLGIGICEDTAVLITEGRKMEVIGSGLVFVIDASKVSRLEIIAREDGSALTMENVVNHILSKGNLFDLQTKRIGKLRYK